ncbi:N-6 DNA methylase [Nocardia sp. SYP-A9097]|uniref:N-6 DNA methylase n=1 Tax=Nocardia sp. SYP-A9097 TaxID=2663237 RepID=UPI00129C0694|nr:N-6 DNA methylase [Nocardia sp. SYP-A9097]MRH92817.1 N-6 DNA methylase [Nocardia sp. SYP-A9097]
MTSQDATLTAADIARMTGYGRAAVSNWRRRYSDFPRPVGGTSASPLFSLAEVEQWLVRAGKRVEVSEEDLWWQQLRSATDDLGLARAVAEVGRKVNESVTGGTSPDLPSGLIEGLGAAEAYEFIVARYLEAHSRRVAVTPAATARLMVDIAEVDDAAVFDPACGVGTLLKAAGAAGAALLAGQERDADAALITASRLALAGGNAEIRSGDSLRDNSFGGSAFDAALCDLPFGDRDWGFPELSSDLRWVYGLPPRGEPELAWVQHLLWHLKPGGRAVVLLPAVVSDRTSGRRVRASLLRAGALRAVFALPGSSAAGSTAVPHLWVLRQPVQGDPLPPRVLFADITAGPVGRVLDVWRSFLTKPDSEPLAGYAVPLMELLDDRVDLNPTRFEKVVGQGDRNVAVIRAELVDLLAESARVVEMLSEVVSSPNTTLMTTVGELLRIGAVSLLRAPARMDTTIGDLPVLGVEDLVAGRSPSGLTTDTPGVVLLEPGDVVVAEGRNRYDPLVVTEGGAALGPRLYALRPESDRIDSNFLACSLHAVMLGRSESASASARSDVRRVPVAQLSLRDQREYGAAYRKVRAASLALRRVAESGDALVARLVDGLADGTLRPDSGQLS